MTAEELIARIEAQLLLPERLLQKLRTKVAEADPPISAEALASFLVQKQHLTAAQTTELLAAEPPELTFGLVADPPAAKPYEDLPTFGAVSFKPTEVADPQAGNSSVLDSFILGPPVVNDPSAADDEEVFTLTPIEESAGESVVEPSSILSTGSGLASSSGIGQLSSDSLFSVGTLSESPAPPEVVPPPVSVAVLPAATKVERTAPGLRKKTKRKNEWDSPLLLIGGGVLLLLLIGGAAIALILNFRGGDEALARARTLRDGGAFGQAIPAYEEFVSGYSSHVLWSAARVELAMVKLRQAVESGGSMEPALAVAQRELTGLENDSKVEEQSIATARPELAEMLPKIADGLANEADAATDEPANAEKFAKLANEALGLCRNAKYVSKEFRDDGALAEIEEKLARVSRRQNTRSELDKGLAAMRTAIESGDTRAAYAAHQGLLEIHPELASNEALRAAIVETSSAEKAGVKFVADDHPAISAERPTPWLAALATGNRIVTANAPASGVFCARIDGALYAFDVTTGKLLWRRYVGFAANSPPVMSRDNVLIVDTKHWEVLNLEGATGKLLWRQELGEPIAVPVLAADRLFVAAESGRLFVVDARSGARTGYWQLAQPLRVPPIVDRTGERLYLTGDHSSIYTISLTDRSCLGVYYLGHSAGSIRVPPAQVLNRLAVIENDGVATCRLRLLSFDEQGAVAKVEAERRLTGLAAAPPLIESRRLIAVTDRGELEAYDVSSTEGEQPLTQVATREPSLGNPLVRHVLLAPGAIWIGDKQLTKYAVLPTGNRLPVQTIENSFVRSTFDNPLAMFGPVLVHVRRPDGRAGVIVAAIDAESGQLFWENVLAVPPAAMPVVDEANRTLAFADVNGLVYRFDDTAIRSRVQDQPLSAGSAKSDSPILTAGTDLGAGRAAFAAPAASNQLVLYDPANARDPVRRLRLPSQIATAMTPFDKGVLVPLEVGQVFYLNPSDGQALAAPFQPRLQPRTKVLYQPAAAVDEVGRQFVITDGQEKIHLVELVDSPQPHLETITSANVGPFPIVSPLAVIGKTVCGATDGGQLARFSLPSLESAGETQLPGDIVWGPYRVGEFLLIATAKEQLVAVVADGKIAWSVGVKDGDLAGQPLVTDGGVLLAYRAGTLERRNFADGELTGKLDVEHPLATGPVRFLDRIVLTAHDGTLLVVEQP